MGPQNMGPQLFRHFNVWGARGTRFLLIVAVDNGAGEGLFTLARKSYLLTVIDCDTGITSDYTHRPLVVLSVTRHR